MMKGKGYIVSHKDEAKTVPCPCGSSTRIFTTQNNDVASLHVTHIMDSQKHYHKKCAEFYYILEGGGILELGDDEVELTPGTAIMIEQGTPHRGRGDFQALIVCIPPFDPDDEYFAD